jgi:hypothetical protein
MSLREIDLCPENPYRPPDWRALYTHLLVDRRMNAVSPEHDGYIRNYLQFCNTYKRVRSSLEYRRMVGHFSPLFWAHRIHGQYSVDFQIIIEATLLTGLPYKEMARWVGLDRRTLLWYEKLWYDLRSRLQHPLLIGQMILGSFEDRETYRGASRTYSRTHYENAFKLGAYYGGPMVLEIMVNGMNKTAFPQRPEAVPAWMDAAVRSFVQSKGVTSLSAIEIYRQNAVPLCELALNAHIGDTSGGNIEVEENLRSALSQIEWSKAGGSVDPESVMSKFSSSPIEPRAYEISQLDQGQNPSLIEVDEAQTIFES